MEGRFISYLRVSTQRQGASGLGLDAQRKAVMDFLNGGKWELIASYVEVESGKKSDRVELMKALEHCERTKSTLVIAKLDRLSRNAAFLNNLMDKGVQFVCADMPFATELTVGILASVAQHEGKMISVRTREALAAAKARGVKLGNPKGLPEGISKKAVPLSIESRIKKADEYAKRTYPIIKGYLNAGMSLRAIGKKMQEQRELTPRDGEKWTANTVRQVLKRVENNK
jgi:DNA invertase Pin-like site-specific DNA recombinase